MFSKDQYQLLDFGDGRCLERFGEFVLVRFAQLGDDLFGGVLFPLHSRSGDAADGHTL